MKEVLTRTAHTEDLLANYFSEPNLTRQLGYGKPLWPLVIIKELIDNALDACEKTETAPEITVILEADAVTVTDNGPGLPPEIIESSLDYRFGTSTNKFYISPTRGQLGNALKCVWSTAYVVNGTGVVEVTACQLHHEIEVHLNRITQVPTISHQTNPSVKKGTSVKVQWPGIASLKPLEETAEFYQHETVASAFPRLIADFSTFNPHATFHLRLPNGQARNDIRHYPASDPRWSKWRTSDPTSALWYKERDLHDLIAAEIRFGNGHKTIRDFVGEFAGLSGTQIRKEVLAEADLSGTLDGLVDSDHVDEDAVRRLLLAMQAASSPVNPARLGVLGKEHLQTALISRGVTPESFKYKKLTGFDDGLPYVVEVAFGVKEQRHLERIIGLNNSLVFKVPSEHMSELLNACRIDEDDPVVILIHQTYPNFKFTGQGKGSIA